MPTFLSGQVSAKILRQQSLTTPIRRQKLVSWEDTRQLCTVSNYIVKTFNPEIDAVSLGLDPRVSKEAKKHAEQVLKEHGAEY